jgi:hypothetical protein
MMFIGERGRDEINVPWSATVMYCKDSAQRSVS